MKNERKESKERTKRKGTDRIGKELKGKEEFTMFVAYQQVLTDGSRVILVPSPQGRLGYQNYEPNDDVYPTRVVGFKVSNMGQTPVNNVVYRQNK